MLAPRSPCWVKEHPTVVFKDHESGEKFGRFGSFSTKSCILNCQWGGGGGGGGGGIYWRETSSTNLTVGDIY